MNLSDLKQIQTKFLCGHAVKDMNFDVNYYTGEKYLPRLEWGLFVIQRMLLHIYKKLLFHDISWESQKMFLQQTLGHPLLLAKPISWSYQAAFLRVAIETLEKNTPEVHEDFYTEYLRLQQLASLEQTHVYKHYRVPQSDKLISVRESPKLFCDGTTGLRTWASSIALCEWFVHNLTDLSQKTLLELGAGVGMAGIMLGQMVENCNIHLTDFHEKVLGILEENVCANPPANSNNLIVSQLDWNSEADYERLSKTCCPDVVYAADVIYDSDLFPALCRVLKCFITCNNSSIIISCGIRNEKTYADFTKILENNGLTIEKEKFCKSNKFYWTDSSEIVIFSVRKKT